MHEQKLTGEMRQCISNCQECHAICLETATHCLTLGGQHASPDHQNLLRTCAEICQTSANFMLRTSEHHTDTCAVCAKVCQACEESCRKMAGTDELMRRCVDICRKCAESCNRMAHAVA